MMASALREPAGDPAVFVTDERARPSQVPVDADHLAALAAAVLREKGGEPASELSIAFVDPSTSADLNSRYRRMDGPTDVLSFAMDCDEDGTGGDRGPAHEAPHMVGDVVICPEVAMANADAHGVPLESELALLVVHGVLHLLGMDHEDEEDARAMEHAEDLLLAAHHGATVRVR